MKAEKFEDYKNPDPRCTYPFTPDAIGYCWGYANAFDNDSLEEFKEISCPKCECWKQEK